jgi:hypothetical protein
MFYTKWWQTLPEFNLLLISAWIIFWFVTVVPKYLNCATFSKDLLAIFMSWICLTSWWRDSNIYLVLSAFTSRPTYLAFEKGSPLISSCCFKCVCDYPIKVLGQLGPFYKAWYDRYVIGGPNRPINMANARTNEVGATVPPRSAWLWNCNLMAGVRKILNFCWRDFFRRM